MPDLFSLSFFSYYRITCYRCNAEIIIGLAVPTHRQPTFVGRFMGQVGFFFYPGDWNKDTRVLTLQCRGAWIDLLGELWEHGGYVRWMLSDYARFWGCDVQTADAVVRDLSRLNTANVTWHEDGSVTVESRRIKRESSIRESNRLRKQQERERKARHRDVTDNVTRKSKSSSESESESESLLSQTDTLVDETFSVRDLVDSWNDVFKNRLPSVEWPLSTSRQRKAAARIKEHRNIEFWQKVFDRIGESRFLLGQGNGTWRCTLDFLVANDTNCVKIFEGSYNNGPQINQHKRFGQQ